MAMNFESQKKSHPVMAGRWVNGKFVEESVADINKPEAEQKPKESKVEVDPGLLAANKLEQDVAAAQERLALEKANQEKVNNQGVGGATLLGRIGEKFIASPEIKKARAEQGVAAAERTLDVTRTAHEALAQAGTLEGARALMDAKEADMAKKVSKMFKMLEYAKTNGLDTSKLEEERNALGKMMQTYADAREKLKSLG